MYYFIWFLTFTLTNQIRLNENQVGIEHFAYKNSVKNEVISTYFNIYCSKNDKNIFYIFQIYSSIIFITKLFFVKSNKPKR